MTFDDRMFMFLMNSGSHETIWKVLFIQNGYSMCDCLVLIVWVQTNEIYYNVFKANDEHFW